MKAMAFGFFAALLFINPAINAQRVRVAERYLETDNKNISGDFHFVSKHVDVSGFTAIAKLEGDCHNTSRESLADLFSDFKATANDFGANCFRVDTSYTDTSHLTTATVTVYYLNPNQLEMLKAGVPQNMIYVVGSLNHEKKGKRFKFNGEKLTLFPLEYLAYQNRAGEEVRISVGGFTGATRWVKGKEGRGPIWFSLSGFGVGGGAMMPPGQIGISFNTGRIDEIAPDLGQFLISVLRQKPASEVSNLATEEQNDD